MRAWCGVTADGDPDRFHAVLAARSIEDATKWVAPVDVVDVDLLPRWASGVRWLLGDDEHTEAAEAAATDEALALELRDLVMAQQADQRVVPATTDGPRQPPSTGAPGAQLYAPFLVRARARLAAHPVVLDGSMTPAAVDACAGQLLAMLMRTSVRVLRSPRPDGTTSWRQWVPERVSVLDGWCALLGTYTALIRLWGITATRWWDATDELIRRIAGDLTQLADARWMAPGAAITQVVPGLGDPHRGLRTVALVRFDDGTRVLVKPRTRGDLDARFDGLAPAIERDGYAWEQWIDERLPSDDDGWDRLARNLGVALAAAARFGAHDLTRPNVAIDGDRIRILDPEALLRPRLRHLAADERPHDAAERLAATALVSLRSDCRRRGSLGGDDGFLADATLEPLRDRGQLILTAFADATRRRSTSLVPARADSGPSTPVRLLLRDSWVYARLIQASCAPEALVDGFQRELVLEQLWRAGRGALDPLDVALRAAEIDGVRDGDIPLFRADADARWLELDRDARVDGALAVAPVDDVVDVTELAPAIDELGALLVAADPSRSTPVAPCDAARAASRPSLTAQAVATMRTLVARPSSSRVLRWLPWNGAVITDPLPHDLLDGRAGLALALVDVGTLADAPDLIDAATELLREVAVALAAEVGALERSVRAEVGPWDLPWGGAYHGIGGLLLALDRCTGRVAPRSFDPATTVHDAGKRLVDLPAMGGAVDDLVLGPLGALTVLGERAGSWAPDGDGRDRPASLPPPWCSLDPRVGRALACARQGQPVSDLDLGDGSSALDRLIAAWLVPCAPGAVMDEPSSGASMLAAIEGALAPGHDDQPRNLSVARSLADGWGARHDRDGRWFAEQLAPDSYRASAVWGAAAVAHALARVDAGGGPPLVVLAPPGWS